MAKPMSGRTLALFELEQDLMSAHTLLCFTGDITLDKELHLAIYRAIKPLLIKQIKARFDVPEVQQTMDLPDGNTPANGDNFSERNPPNNDDKESVGDGFSESPEARQERVQKRLDRSKKP